MDIGERTQICLTFHAPPELRAPEAIRQSMTLAQTYQNQTLSCSTKRLEVSDKSTMNMKID